MNSTTRLKSLLPAFLAGAGALFCTMPAAAVTIDSFTTNQAAVADPPGNAPTVVTGGADIIGTRRALNADTLSGVGPTTTTVTGGALTLAVTNTTPDSRGEAIVTWDGDTTAGNLNVTGLAGQNLTAGSHNTLRIRVNSASAGTEILVDVYTSATASSRGFLRIPTAVAAATDFYLTYKYDFVRTAATAADFTNVGAIVMRVRGTEVSAALDQVDTVGPSLAATKRDLDLANSPIAGPVLEGSTFKYRIIVDGTGGGLAEGIDLSDTVDANTTLNAATVLATPVAIDDAYLTVGHVGLAEAAPGLLANDFDPDTNGGGPELQVAGASVGVFPTTLGGTISVSADGAFSYEPPVGLGRAVDTFTYTLQDNDGQTTTGLVKVAIGTRVWFVDDAHPGTNQGTRSNPFVGFTAANVNGAAGAGDVDGESDIIFIYSGNHSAQIQLENAQALIGEGEGLIVDGRQIVAPGADPVLSSAAHGVVLAQNNILRGFTVGATGTTSFDINGSAFGTVTISNVVLSGAGGAVSLTTGAVDASFDSIASTSGTHGINLDGITSGSFTVAGTTTLSNSSFGLRVNSSPTLATNFNGTASLTTSAGAALFASNGGTLSFTGASNTATATNGPAVDLTGTSLGSGATFATVSATTNNSKGVNLDNVTGAFTGSGGAISVTAGGNVGFDLNAGSSNVTYAGTITSTAANRLVEITARTGGTTALSGNLSGSGAGHTGINVASNTGGTINFSAGAKTINTGANAAVTLATNTGATINFTGGGLDIDTTSGAGFNATGGAAALTVQGTGNTITSTSGTALTVANSTIGASGLTFQSIASNGAPSGIVLNATGASAGLTVTGTGTNNSGGVIAASTGDGISLTSTRNISLTEMAINNSAQSHFDATTVTGLTLTNVDTDTSNQAGLRGNGITNLTISGGTFNRGGAGGEPTCNVHGFDITNLLGTSSVTGVTISRSNTIQFRVNNTAATTAAPGEPADVLTVSGTTWNNHTGPCSGDHLSVTADTGGNFKLITNSTSGENNFRTGGIGVQVTGAGNGTAQASLTGLDSSGNTAGVAVAAGGSGNVRFNVFDNRTALGTGFSGTGSVALIMTCTTTGTCEGAFNNNTVSHTAGTSTNAIQAVVEGNGTGRIQISNNVVSGNFQRGIHAQSRLGTGSLSVIANNNNLTQTDLNGLQVVNLEVGASGGGTTNSLCVNLASNSATPAGGNSAYRLLHRAGYTFQLQNLAQASTTNTADVMTWVTTTKANTGAPVSVTVGATPFTSVSACPTPTLPSP